MLELLVERNFVFTAVTVRSSVLEAVGGFNATLTRAQDWELWLRILASGRRAVRPPGLQAVYRRRADSLSEDRSLVARQVREILRMVAEEYDVPESVRVRARARMDTIDTRLAESGPTSLRRAARRDRRSVR